MTLHPKSFKRLRANRDRVSASQYNALLDLIEKMSRSLTAHGFMDSSGFSIRRPNIPKAAGEIHIFEVQSNDTGDGVYNCHRHRIKNDSGDDTDWDATNGTDKIEEKNTTDVYILNLLEHHVNATYARALHIGDRMYAWQVKDEAGTPRWIGIPIGPHSGQVYRAQVQEDAPGDNKISVKLTNQDGTEIDGAFDVTCEIAGPGSALNAAIPRLDVSDNDIIFVTNIGGTWYCTTTFQTTEDCVCS